MDLDPRLTTALVCPVCKGTLVKDENEPLLVCPRCRLGFEVVDGIANMIAEQAREISAEDAEKYRQRLSVVRGA